MPNSIKRIAKALANNGGIFMFLRAQFASQISSITDFCVTILLFKVFALFYVYATFLGSVAGGVVNCAINYRWTFKRSDLQVKYVAIRFLMVWIGSTFFNTYGTYLVTELLKELGWLREFLGHFFDDVFLVAKLFVSILVGFLWNYTMMRYFVYRNYDIKKNIEKVKKHIVYKKEKEDIDE